MSYNSKNILKKIRVNASSARYDTITSFFQSTFYTFRYSASMIKQNIKLKTILKNRRKAFDKYDFKKIKRFIKNAMTSIYTHELVERNLHNIYLQHSNVKNVLT